MKTMMSLFFLISLFTFGANAAEVAEVGLSATGVSKLINESGERVVSTEVELPEGETAVCNYAAGEVLLTGGGSSSYTGCEFYYPYGCVCSGMVENMSFACMSGGRVTRQGTLLVRHSGLFLGNECK